MDERFDKAKDSNLTIPNSPRWTASKSDLVVSPLVKTILFHFSQDICDKMKQEHGAGRKVLYEIIEDEERSPGLSILWRAIG
jgi:hypothetical protein